MTDAAVRSSDLEIIPLKRNITEGRIESAIARNTELF